MTFQYCQSVFKIKKIYDAIYDVIIHSKYFPVSDWLKPHA